MAVESLFQVSKSEQGIEVRCQVLAELFCVQQRLESLREFYLAQNEMANAREAAGVCS
jgi:hypothetical protein